MVSGGWWMVYGGWLRLVLPLCLSPFLPPFLPFLSHPTYLPISLPPVPPLEKHGDIFVPRRTPTPPYLSLLAPLNLPPYLPPYSLLPFLPTSLSFPSPLSLPPSPHPSLSPLPPAPPPLSTPPRRETRGHFRASSLRRTRHRPSGPDR